MILTPMISYLKLFHQNGETMVALYGNSSEYEDGWLRNLPASNVFLHNPGALPTEQTLPLAAAAQLQPFTPEFLSQLTPDPEPVRLAQLVDELSASSELPAGRVRTILLAVLSQFAGLIEAGEGFSSPVLGFTPIALPAVPAQDDRPAILSRKLARLTVKPQFATDNP